MSEVEAKIQEALSAYLADPAILGLTKDLAVPARTLNALPVYADIGGALLIKPSGEVLCVHSDQAWNEASQYRAETDPARIDLAYATCAVRFPALRDVIYQLREAGKHSDFRQIKP
jgi:hypothetical protein